jgi:uncharacterized protein DUF4157
MKTAKSKTLARRPKATPAKVTPAKKGGPFFKREGGTGFFEPGRSGFFAEEPVAKEHAADTIQEKCAACEQEERLQPKEMGAERGVDGKVRRKPIFESEADPPDEPVIQRKPVLESVTDALPQNEKGEGRHEAPVSIESKLNATKGSGSPLPEGTRNEMETSIGGDFKDVRIHRNVDDAAMNKQLNAQAFTHGKDIYFNDGKYDPQSKGGKHLLAHELTHVVQQGGGKPDKSPGLATQPDVSGVSPKIQRGVIDDVASHLLTGNALLDFLVGVVAGIVEWFGDFIMGIASLIKEAFEGNIAAIVALGLVIIVIVLACVFPEVVIPVLVVIGIVLGIISLAYYIYMMTRPGLTAYERGKYLGKAIVEGVLLAFTVVEALRTLKVLEGVSELAKGVGLLQKLRWVRQLMKLGDTAKVLQVLLDVGDVEKTIEFLKLAKDVEKAAKVLELAGGASKIDDLIGLLKSGAVTVDDLIDLLNIKGVALADIKDLLSIPGVTAADLKDLLPRVGMTAADLKDLLRKPGMTVADLKDFLGKPGMTVADLKDLLGRPGMTVADLKDLLGKPGMTVAELKGLLGRPGMTVADLKDLMGRAGMTVPDLKDLLALADDPGQLRRLLTLVPTIADLKNYFRLAGGHGQGVLLEAVLNKANALGDVKRAEDLLNIAAGNAAKFTELAEALQKFRVLRAPGGAPHALHGYAGIDLIHMQARHTFEFFDFPGAIEPNPIKAANTLWPAGTDVAARVEEALTIFDGKHPPQRIPPFAAPPVTDTLGDGTRFQIGVNNANQVGQFFPFADAAKGIITFTRQEMQAFKKLLLP